MDHKLLAINRFALPMDVLNIIKDFTFYHIKTIAIKRKNINIEQIKSIQFSTRDGMTGQRINIFSNVNSSIRRRTFTCTYLEYTSKLGKKIRITKYYRYCTDCGGYLHNPQIPYDHMRAMNWPDGMRCYGDACYFDNVWCQDYAIVLSQTPKEAKRIIKDINEIAKRNIYENAIDYDCIR